MNKPIIALMYDFDRTLATEDMQNFSFIPNLGMTPQEFWKLTDVFCKKYDTDKILGYMYVMIDECRKKNIKMTKEYLQAQGKAITYFKGVLSWFDRINEYAKKKGFVCEHYLITSGNKEIVEGSKIADKFSHIFGCEYCFDPKTKEAIWPTNMVNYTQKTQYYYKISKGVYKNTEDKKVNEKTLNRRIPYRNMIYFGDGMTDVPIMITAKKSGSTSIAVYQERNFQTVTELLKDERVNFICKSDYSPNKELEKTVKLIIDGIAVQEQLCRKK